MSKENMEIVRRAVEAFNRGDFEDYLAEFAPDFEYHASGVVPDARGVYRGLAEYRQFMDAVFGEFDNLHVEVSEVTEVGDQVLLTLNLRGRGKQSGVQTSWSFCQVWTMRDGKISRGQGFTSKADALEAAGLSE